MSAEPGGPSHRQDAGDANLRALEALMDEFFSSEVSNIRKAEIERLLADFGQQTSCWRDSLTFLSRTNNPYVSMFALTTIENTIRRRWMGMMGPEKTQIRTELHGYLLKRHVAIPAYIRNKVIKLLVDIACTDWPHFYPTFFTDIIEWIHGGSETVLIGLCTLLITSEELATPRDNVVSSRKEELRRLLVAQVPQMMSSLCMVLESVLELFQGGATGRINMSTPPPSPSPSNSLDQDEDSSSGDSMFNDTGNLLHVAKDMLNQGGRTGLSWAPGSDVVEVATLALKCLNHLFTWVPLSTVISSRLLASVFHFAGLGIPALSANSSTGSADPSYNAYTNTQLSILAMGTINEIIYRHCVPADFEDFLLRMFMNTFQLLRLLVQPENPERYQLQTLDESYVDKFTEFIHSFVQSHLRRFENSLSFPVSDFLSLLFKYTFEQQRCEGYLSCLDIWCTFVDSVNGIIANRSSESLVVKAKYREALTSLVSEVLKKLQFRFNASALEDMDDETFDDDEETQWQHYLRASVETIMKVSEILPEDVLRIVDAPWKETWTVYLQLEKYVQNGKLQPNPDQVVQLHHVLRDFASLLQIIGRLSLLFVGDNFEEYLNDGLMIVKQLIELAAFGSRAKLYCVEVSPVLRTDFVLAHAQTLAALQAWCHWLSPLHKLALKDKSYEHLCKDLISKVMVAVSSVLRDGSDGDRKLLVHSAAHFLGTLTSSVRPPSIWKLKEFTELYGNLHKLNLVAEDHRLMVRALSNVLLLPWRGIQEQRWDERQRHLSKFLQDLTSTFRNLRSIPGFPSNKQIQEEAKPVIIHSFQVICDLAENVRDEGSSSKKLCNELVSEYVSIALWLLPIYVTDRKMCEEAFAFFQTVLDVLKGQMGAQSVEQVVQTVLTLFDKDQLSETIRSEGGNGVRVVEKLLEILQLVVKETDVTFRRFIDSALSLCMDHIYPLVADKLTSDIKGPLYLVLYNVLLHNWRHFFKSNAVRTLMPGSGGSPGQQDQVLHQARFVAVLQAFGQSFLQPDISVFKQNLLALEDINAKWKLYQKPVFTEHLIVQFLTVLVQVLINNSHNLLKEEITTCLYNMASVDFNSFFGHFLPHFVMEQEGLDDNQKMILKSSFKTDTDMPSFMANMDRLVNDLRYYKVCNASLPAGSVRFSL